MPPITSCGWVLRRGRRLAPLAALAALAVVAACEPLPYEPVGDAWRWDGRSDGTSWDVPAAADDWPERAAAIRAEVRAVLEPFLPAAPDVALVAEERLAEGLLRQHLEFTTFDGERATAVLMRPDDDLPRPGLLLVHGHDASAEAMTTDVDTYVRSLGLELARAGFVTLSPDVRSFGAFLPGGRHHWRSDGYVAQVQRDGDVYLRLAVNDARVALRLLRELPGVDPGGIGVAGISLGSLVSLVAAAAEGDVDAVVLSGLFLPFDVLFEPGRHHSCQHLLALADVAPADELAATLLLGHVQVHWGAEDPYFRADGGDQALADLAERALWLGLGEHLDVRHTAGQGHAFHGPTQAAFFARALAPPQVGTAGTGLSGTGSAGRAALPQPLSPPDGAPAPNLRDEPPRGMIEP